MRQKAKAQANLAHRGMTQLRVSVAENTHPGKGHGDPGGVGGGNHLRITN
jgi:hypothetical protein